MAQYTHRGFAVYTMTNTSDIVLPLCDVPEDVFTKIQSNPLYGHQLKETMSPGLHSFFVITLLIVYKTNYCFSCTKCPHHTNRKISSEFSKLLVFSDCFKTQRHNLKMLAQLF